MYYKSIRFFLALKSKWLQALLEVHLLLFSPQVKSFDFHKYPSLQITFTGFALSTQENGDILSLIKYQQPQHSYITHFSLHHFCLSAAKGAIIYILN